jgi:hypothetical protein
MRFITSFEHLKFFQTKGYLELQDLLTKEQAISLISAIDAVRLASPGYPLENLFRSIPLICTLAKNRGWGQVAAELLHKKPLRLGYDKFFITSPSLAEPLEDDSCGLLIELNARKGFFFQHSLLPKSLYNSCGSCYFLLIMTAKYLPEKLNPLIVK